MKVDTAKLLQLIASKPQIRTMELADRLNHEMSDIDEALVPLLDAGTIITIGVIAPSGRNATGYQLSEAARAQRIQSAPAVSIDSNIDRAIALITERGTVSAGQLHAYLGLKPNDLVSRELEPALADGRLVKDGKDWSLAVKPEFPAIPAPARTTNVERAVEFLAAMPGNRCTNDQMRMTLGLAPTSQVSPFLKRGVDDGRLKRAGPDWVLGAAPVAVEDVKPAAPVVAPRAAKSEAPLDSVVAVGKIVVASKDASPIPQAVVDPITSAPVVEEASFSRRPPPEIPLAVIERTAVPERVATPAQLQCAAPIPFRCGIWSDGILELQRGGQIVAALTREECVQVVEFLHGRAA